MEHKTGVVILVVGAIALTAVGVVTFAVPLPGTVDGATDTRTPLPTGTPLQADPGEDAPFAITVDAVEECGQTCRDVTVTLRNNQPTAATEVAVRTRVYAGRDTSAEDDLVWTGSTDVGTLDAGASDTTTERVELSFAEALRVERRDGWVTIRMTVRSDELTVTFTRTEQVA